MIQFLFFIFLALFFVNIFFVFLSRRSRNYALDKSFEDSKIKNLYLN
jgi:hypothetical protein